MVREEVPFMMHAPLRELTCPCWQRKFTVEREVSLNGSWEKRFRWDLTLAFGHEKTSSLGDQ